MTLLRPLALGLVLCAAGLPALAARPMITDDARIVDAKACQVESWVRSNRQGASQAWAVPGCNPTGNLELSVGGGFERQDGQARLADSLVQGKTILRPLAPNGWGLGLTLGRSIERGLAPGSTNAPSNYLNVSISRSYRDDAVVAHINLGLRDDRQAGHTFATWGLATEVQLRPGLQLIAETYGESRSRPFVHGGLRYWVVPERVQVDATYGAEARRDGQRWVSLGLRLLSPAFLP